MSRTVRIKEHLYAELEKLAAQEKRSLANMVEILLEQVLALEKGGFDRIMSGDRPVGLVIPKDVTADAQPRDIPARSIKVTEDPHFKPDFK